MNKQIFDYFKGGFSLTNKSRSLFFIGLLLSLLSSTPDLLVDSFVKSVLQVIGFLLLIIASGFSFSLPVFLVEKQQGKALNLSNILSITLGNIKRFMLPFILIIILFSVLALTIYFLVAIFIYGGNLYFMQNIQTQGLSLWNLIFTLLVGLSSFGTFTSVYFSLEKKGLFSSIKKSISLSFQNLSFIMIIFVISASTYLVLALFLDNYQSTYQLFIRNVVFQFEVVLITAASLIFYQNHNNGK